VLGVLGLQGRLLLSEQFSKGAQDRGGRLVALGHGFDSCLPLVGFG